MIPVEQRRQQTVAVHQQAGRFNDSRRVAGKRDGDVADIVVAGIPDGVLAAAAQRPSTRPFL